MNVLYIVPEISPSHGGFNRFFKLQERGHNIYVLGPKLSSKEPFFEKMNGVSIFRHSYLFKINNLNYIISFPINDIRMIVDDYKIDVIHSLMIASTSTLCVAVYSKLSSSCPPLLSSIQGGIPIATGNAFSTFLAKLYYNSMGKIVLRTSEKVIALSDSLKNQAIELGVKEEKIVICPPGVDTERFDPNFLEDSNKLRDSSTFHIGFVGRFVPLKGVTDLIMASKMLLKKYKIHLILVGDGPLKTKLEEMVCKLKIPATFVGWVANPEKYYSNMDIFVLPSYSEGFSRSCLEAMAMKKPLIVTDVGANKEIIRDGENGFIVPPGNPKILAEKIISLIEDVSLIEEWGRKNRNIVEKNYTLDKELTTLEKIYYEAIDRSN